MEFVLNHSRMENLSVLWENFSLSEYEGKKYKVYEKGYEVKFLLAAKFFLRSKYKGSRGGYL